MEERTILLDKIDFNPYQARTIFDEDKLAELAASMEANGQLVAIGVYQYQDRYIVHDGDRRVKAARKNGWTEIRAEIHGVLETLDKLDPTVLEMREKADQANTQRDDITPMDRARSRAALYEDGVKSGRYKTVKAFAVHLPDASLTSVRCQLIAAKDEKELFGGVRQLDDELVPDSVDVYTRTVPLRETPDIRKKVIAAIGRGEIPNSGSPIQVLSLAIASAPEMADTILEIAKDRALDPGLIRSAVWDTSELEPELRSRVLKMRAAGKISYDELKSFAEVLKTDPDLVEYAIDLKTRGESMEDVRRSVNVVKSSDPARARFMVDARAVAREDPTAFKIEVSEADIESSREMMAGFEAEAAKISRQISEVYANVPDGACLAPCVVEMWCEDCNWGFDVYTKEAPYCPYCGEKNVVSRQAGWSPRYRS